MGGTITTLINLALFAFFIKFCVSVLLLCIFANIAAFFRAFAVFCALFKFASFVPSLKKIC